MLKTESGFNSAADYLLISKVVLKKFLVKQEVGKRKLGSEPDKQVFETVHEYRKFKKT